MNTKIICVYNKQEFYEKVVVACEYHQNCDFFGYDNTKENMSIPKRYNHFIKTEITQSENPESQGFWCIFMHQDFAFREDPDLIIKDLDKNCIYGPIGVILKPIPSANTSEPVEEYETVFYGKVAQRVHQKFVYIGSSISGPTTVEVLDCCCMIIHSSLIKKYNLLFDENLNFHMYAEEFSLSAKKNYGIETKVIEIECFHLGMGKLDDAFKTSAQYLKEKFNISRVPSTCKN